MLVHLVRHGQSYNTHPAPDQPTPANPPLTLVGEMQARLVAERLRPLGVDRLVSSPMVRAIDTARFIAPEVGLPIEVWPRCHEFRETPGYRCWGARGLRLHYPDLILPPNYAEDEWEYGNEPLASAIARADEFLGWLEAEAARSATRRMVVVTHGAITRVVLSRVISADPDAMQRMTTDNTAVSTLELAAGGLRVLGLNDTSHLAGLPELDPVLGVTR